MDQPVREPFQTRALAGGEIWQRQGQPFAAVVQPLARGASNGRQIRQFAACPVQTQPGGARDAGKGAGEARGFLRDIGQ